MTDEHRSDEPVDESGEAVDGGVPDASDWLAAQFTDDREAEGDEAVAGPGPEGDAADIDPDSAWAEASEAGRAWVTGSEQPTARPVTPAAPQRAVPPPSGEEPAAPEPSETVFAPGAPIAVGPVAPDPDSTRPTPPSPLSTDPIVPKRLPSAASFFGEPRPPRHSAQVDPEPAADREDLDPTRVDPPDASLAPPAETAAPAEPRSPHPMALDLSALRGQRSDDDGDEGDDHGSGVANPTRAAVDLPTHDEPGETPTAAFGAVFGSTPTAPVSPKPDEASFTELISVPAEAQPPEEPARFDWTELPPPAVEPELPSDEEFRPEPARQAEPELGDAVMPVPAPVAPEPAGPEPAGPEPAGPEPAAPESAAPERAAPDSAAPELAPPEPETPAAAAPASLSASAPTQAFDFELFNALQDDEPQPLHATRVFDLSNLDEVAPVAAGQRYSPDDLEVADPSMPDADSISGALTPGDTDEDADADADDEREPTLTDLLGIVSASGSVTDPDAVAGPAADAATGLLAAADADAATGAVAAGGSEGSVETHAASTPDSPFDADATEPPVAVPADLEPWRLSDDDDSEVPTDADAPSSTAPATEADAEASAETPAEPSAELEAHESEVAASDAGAYGPPTVAFEPDSAWADAPRDPMPPALASSVDVPTQAFTPPHLEETIAVPTPPIEQQPATRALPSVTPGGAPARRQVTPIDPSQAPAAWAASAPGEGGPGGPGSGAGGAGFASWPRERKFLIIGAIVAAVVVVALLVVLFFFGRSLASGASSASDTSAQLVPKGGPGSSSARSAAPSTPAAPQSSAPQSAAPQSPAPAAEAATGPAAPGTHQWSDLRGGECLGAFQNQWQQTYAVVDCAAAHPAQMVSKGTLAGAAGAAYPGDAALQSQTGLTCAAPTVVNFSAAQAYTGVQVSASYPTADQWASGERSYYCFVSRSDNQTMTTSLAVSG